MLICDSQVHIWEAETPERPWTAGGADLVRDMGHRPEPIGYEELKDLMDEAGVDRTLIVPPTWDLDRNDLGLAAAEKYPDRFGLIARVPLLNPKEGEAMLRSFQDMPGVKGVRLTFFRKEEATWLPEGVADWYWPIAEELGVVTMVHAAQFKKEIAAVAEKHPKLNLIMDHMGVQGGPKDEALTPIVDETITLARYPNISVKVSGLPAKTTDPYPFPNLEKYVRGLVDAFGAERCYWGTDLSRMLGFRGVTYSECVTHFTEHMPFLSEQQLDLIMGRALCDLLGWSVD